MGEGAANVRLALETVKLKLGAIHTIIVVLSLLIADVRHGHAFSLTLVGAVSQKTAPLSRYNAVADALAEAG